MLAQVDDLLIGDLLLSDDLRADEYVDRAWEEIVGALGFTYDLPLPDPGDMDEHTFNYLKSVHVNLASGRLLAALASARGDETTSLYAQALIREAHKDLVRVTTGGMLLGLPIEDDTAAESRVPTIVTADNSSGVEHYYGYMSGQTVGETWLPGQH